MTRNSSAYRTNLHTTATQKDVVKLDPQLKVDSQEAPVAALRSRSDLSPAVDSCRREPNDTGVQRPLDLPLKRPASPSPLHHGSEPERKPDTKQIKLRVEDASPASGQGPKSSSRSQAASEWCELFGPMATKGEGKSAKSKAANDHKSNVRKALSKSGSQPQPRKPALLPEPTASASHTVTHHQTWKAGGVETVSTSQKIFDGTEEKIYEVRRYTV